jgi:carbon storage regulator
MLVIRRRAGEAIMIGDGIEVEILEVGAGRVKLGVSAPKNVRVLRKEVEQTRQENVAAATSDAEQLLALLRSTLSAGSFPRDTRL